MTDPRRNQNDASKEFMGDRNSRVSRGSVLSKKSNFDLQNLNVGPFD